MSGITTNMEFVVLVSVFAITLTQVAARPTDDGSNTKDGLQQKSSSDVEVFEYKLPTAVTPEKGFDILVTGILNMNHDTFTALLPFDGSDEDSHCRIEYHYKNQQLSASPAVSEHSSYKSYKICNETKTEGREFTLTLHPEIRKEQPMFKIHFHENESTTSDLLYCKIESFENVGSIRFKEGVHKITSLQFTFDN